MPLFRTLLTFHIDHAPLEQPWEVAKTLTEARLVDQKEPTADTRSNTMFGLQTGLFVLTFDANATVDPASDLQVNNITTQSNAIVLCTSTTDMSYSVGAGTHVRGIL